MSANVTANRIEYALIAACRYYAGGLPPTRRDQYATTWWGKYYYGKDSHEAVQRALDVAIGPQCQCEECRLRRAEVSS